MALVARVGVEVVDHLTEVFLGLVVVQTVRAELEHKGKYGRRENDGFVVINNCEALYLSGVSEFPDDGAVDGVLRGLYSPPW